MKLQGPLEFQGYFKSATKDSEGEAKLTLSIPPQDADKVILLPPHVLFKVTIEEAE